MSMIQISELTFQYDGSYDPIFENVSFRIDTDWKLGFVGRNGRGKTTFLQLLMGNHSEYRGSIIASVSFDYFPFVVSDLEKSTSVIIAEIVPEAQPWAIARELSLLHVADDVLTRPFRTLSNGEQTKILLAALFLKENRFLLIDEPTNHLDTAARAIVSAYLNSKKGFILVSHDRDFLDHCIDHILSINRANIEVQRGNFSTWLENKEARDHDELTQNDALKREIKKLTVAARRTADWSNRVESTKMGTLVSGIKPDKGRIGHKAAKMMQRAKSVENRKQAAVSDKAKLLQNIETADALAIKPLTFHTERLITISDLSIQYGDKKVCDRLSFSIESGQRIALRGKNGCGKSSILKLLRGESVSHTGSILMNPQLTLSYIPQDTAFLAGDLKIYTQAHNLDESLFKAILRKLDFSRVQFDKDMADFSGGQKKKVLLAKSLCERAHLYVWDEPLNFIDVLSRIQIEELILRYKPTLLFVEHDRAFTERVATQVLDL